MQEQKNEIQEREKFSQDTKVNNHFPNLFVAVDLCFTAILFVVILLTVRAKDIQFNNEKVCELTGPWQVSCGIHTKQAELPFLGENHPTETITYQTVLPKQEDTGSANYNSIMLNAVHESVKVYVENELLYEYGEDQGVIFSDDPGNGRLIVRLPEDFEGKILKIEKKGFFEDYTGDMLHLWIGTKNALVFHVYNTCMPAILINLCIIFFSICILAASLSFKNHQTAEQLRYLSLFSLATSIWLILESGGYQFFAGSPPLIANTIFIVFSLLPLLFIRFLLTFESFLHDHYMRCLLYVAFGSAVLIHILQLTGIVYYLKTIFMIHIIMFLIIVGIAKKFIEARMKKESLKEKYLYVSCLVLAIFVVVDIIRFYLIPAYRPTLYSQIGILLYFLILCYFAVKKIVQDHENSLNKLLYEQMAYRDILTGLPNRNAFEREMDSFRANQELHPTILLADLNELKKINDTLGHKAGDEAISLVGNVIQNYFIEKGNAFRIGGDEFCVIFQEMPEELLEEQMSMLREQIDEISKEKEASISIAAGWCRKTGDITVDKTFQLADSRMYVNKKQMKNKRGVMQNG